MIDEKVKIKCTKCSQVFRERAHRIRDGLQTNCAHCNRLITFDNNSEDRNIRKALMSAKEVRLAIEAQRNAAREAQLAPPAPAPVLDRSQY
jgi:predicted  nucleic acid-binding Zn-ribbon protein